MGGINSCPVNAGLPLTPYYARFEYLDFFLANITNPTVS